VFNLTGELEQYDLLVEKGVALAVKEQNAAGGINGRPIQYKAYDGGSESTKIAAATTQAINDKCVALIALSDTDSALTAAPIGAKAGIPLITVGATSPRLVEVGETMFLAAFGDNVQAAAGADFLHDTLKAQRIYLLTNVGDEYTRSLSRYFRIHWDELAPNTIVLSDTYQVGDTDFSAQIQRLRAVQPPPDAFYIASDAEEVASVLAALRGAGFTQPIMGGDSYDGTEIMALNDKPSQEIYYTSHGAWPPPATGPLADFAANFKKEFSTEADSIFVALGYDGAKLLLSALQRAPDTSGPALRTSLEGTRAFHGLTGTLSFAPGRDGHIPSKEVTVMVIRDGAATAVKSVLPSRVPPP
jgi:branched-chain amino acid transport system substrate-binding protein